MPAASDGPRRTCIGCRKRGAPIGWLRIARGGDGPQSGDMVDRFGLGPGAVGRGAWLCSMECFDLAVRRKAFERALRCEVSSDDIARLRARLSNNDSSEQENL